MNALYNKNMRLPNSISDAANLLSCECVIFRLHVEIHSLSTFQLIGKRRSTVEVNRLKHHLYIWLYLFDVPTCLMPKWRIVFVRFRTNQQEIPSSGFNSILLYFSFKTSTLVMDIASLKRNNECGPKPSISIKLGIRCTLTE